MLYHISNVHGLKILEPRISTHGQAYVYAVDNLTNGLLFGAKKDDFDFIIDTDESGKPEIYECYEDAFIDIYKGVSCSIYEIEDLEFKKGMTGWEPEYVSKASTKILNEIVVNDLHKRLLEERDKGKLIMHKYDDSMKYRKMISNHIVDRLIKFNILDKPNIEDRIKNRYGKIINILQAVLSGKYL